MQHSHTRSKSEKNQADEMRPFVKKWGKLAREQAAEDNRAFANWHSKHQAAFDLAKTFSMVNDDPTAINVVITARNPPGEASTSLTQSDSKTLAVVSQCKGLRRRKEDGQRVLYQQDHANAMPMPYLNKLTSRELVHCVRQAFNDVHQKTAAMQDGCTATLVLVQDLKDKSGKRVICFNLGDSRAALFTEGKLNHATVDHKPTHPEEVARLQKVISDFDPTQQNRLHAIREYQTADGKTVKGKAALAISRSFGNKDFAGSSAEPAITVFDVADPEHARLLMCSDGVWDTAFVKDIEKIMLNETLTDEQKNNQIRRVAYERGEYLYRNYKTYVPDNITSLLGRLDDTGAFLVLDGHGATDFCVNQVANGDAELPSLLECVAVNIKKMIHQRQNEAVADLPVDVQLSATLGASPSISISIDDDNSTLPLSEDNDAYNPFCAAEQHEALTPPASQPHPLERKRKVVGGDASTDVDTDVDESASESHTATSDQPLKRRAMPETAAKPVTTSSEHKRRPLMRCNAVDSLVDWMNNRHLSATGHRQSQLPTRRQSVYPATVMPHDSASAPASCSQEAIGGELTDRRTLNHSK